MSKISDERLAELYEDHANAVLSAPSWKPWIAPMSRNNGLSPYASFDDWFHEQEGFGLRSERFEGNVEWLKSAFAAGRASPIQADGLEVVTKPWPLGGYAPGSYACMCLTCRAGFIGDKRAHQCLPCASSQAQSALAAMKGERDEALAAYQAAHAEVKRLTEEADAWLAQLTAAETAEARIKALKEALRSSDEALCDWLNIYAPDMCDEARVFEAQGRVGEVGTIAYIADRLQVIRTALSESNKP